MNGAAALLDLLIVLTSRFAPTTRLAARRTSSYSRTKVISPQWAGLVSYPRPGRSGHAPQIIRGTLRARHRDRRMLPCRLAAKQSVRPRLPDP